MSKMILKPGRETSLKRHHPWVFSGAVSKIVGNPKSGETIEILSAEGDFLAVGAFSPASKISARIWTWDPDELIDDDFFNNRIAQAIKLREDISSSLIGTDASRLIYGESDRLPGLIVDRYGEILVVQFLTAGTELWKNVLVDILKQIPGISCIYERSDVDVRELEGLSSIKGVLWGDDPKGYARIHENGIPFLVDVHEGHKTGFYLDQRLNRRIVRSLSAGRNVLDCFSYTGGFTVNALRGGAASVIAVDSSEHALSMLRENIANNQLVDENLTLIEGDVFQELRHFRDHRMDFDMVILDPPKFAHTALLAERAARGYKDINLLAFKLLRNRGLLVTFSCSGGVSDELFNKIVAGAASDAGVDARVLLRLHQDVDHPVASSFPEGAYLKGLVLYVTR